MLWHYRRWMIWHYRRWKIRWQTDHRWMLRCQPDHRCRGWVENILAVVTPPLSYSTRPYPTLLDLPDPILPDPTRHTRPYSARHYPTLPYCRLPHYPTLPELLNTVPHPFPYPTLHDSTYPTLASQPIPTLPDLTLNRVPAINRFELMFETSCALLATLSLVYVALHQRLIASKLCSEQAVHC